MTGQKITEKPNVTLKINKTIDFYADRLRLKWRDLIWPLVNPRFEHPVFVVGCSRSGTTAVYKVLSMAPELASMQKESHGFWNSLHPLSENNYDSHTLTAEDIKERDWREVSRFYFRHLGKRRFIDKANQNCFRIPYLQAFFPDAFFVYVKRDGRDNINSLIHGWGRPDEYAAWSRDLPADIKIENGKYQNWSFFLFQGWRSFMKSSIEDVCAHQWIEANKAVLSSKGDIPQDQWIELFYEDILRSAKTIFGEIYGKLNLSFTDPIRQHCETLTANPYNAFSKPRLEKWKEENPERIGRILPIIKPTMLDMGYEI